MPTHIVIIGGGLAGLSAGCYALNNGYRCTIVEHSLALGGVCTAWPRGPYMIDGCIHWLTGGAFSRVYEELEILPALPLRTLETWNTYRDVHAGFEVAFTRDLDAFVGKLHALAPEDGDELQRIRDGARRFVEDMHPPLSAQELMSVRDSLRAAWELRHSVGTLMHFRKPLGTYVTEHLRSPKLQRLFTSVLPEAAPALFLLMVLGYLERGYLSRPVGGTAAFRDALVRTYEARGGQTLLHSTVDEILVDGQRASGVRLADGTQLEADIVISTASAPETVLRLLGGRYDAAATRERLASWQLIEPIVLASYGVAQAYADQPALLQLDRIEPFYAAGRWQDRLYLRVCNDDASYAPAGHSVLQALVPTDYAYWATLGTRYTSDKDAVAEAVLTQLEAHFPGVRPAVRVIDVATPLTYWQTARSWRGAYEGWIPQADATFAHVPKTLRGLSGFYMAGQWVEPGGGVPTAVTSGRQAVELICRAQGRGFVPTPKARGV